MDINEYSKLALRTANDLGSEMNNIMHAAMGIAGEGGEVIDLVKKSFAYGKPLDRQKLLDEAMDGVWYTNLLLHTLGVTWEQAFAHNITKLEARYPDLRFDADKANNRDTQLEQAAINKVL